MILDVGRSRDLREMADQIRLWAQTRRACLALGGVAGCAYERCVSVIRVVSQCLII